MVNRGWHFERSRHSLAAQGVKTGSASRYILAPPFKSANKLPVQVAIIVPRTKGNVNLSDEDFKKRSEQERNAMIKMFGADTSVNTLGSYFDENKKRVDEDGVMITSSTTVDNYNRMRTRFARHVENRQEQWVQETVFVRVEGQDFIIPMKDYIADDKQQHKNIFVS
jgi:hypothetical protein